MIFVLVLVYIFNNQIMFEKHNYKMIVSKIYTGDRCILPATFEEKDIYASNTIRLFVKNNSGLMA